MHASGALKTIVCQTYPLERVADALNSLKARTTYGKVIIRPQPRAAQAARSKL